ncbi:MAG TPA: helix-turn-helix domain-containing protein [Allosphingosinicella sp.]|nr:helix-turn-helix domain-containing protein [Allosphingosinicella sp.]
MPRHLHEGGYANVVLAGRFTEAAFAGRFRAEPGMALIHAPFDCHANVESGRRGPTILRLPWRDRAVEGAFRVRDPDLLARLSERDLDEAELALRDMIEPIDVPHESWADALAAALAGGSIFALRDWAERRGLSPGSLSRGFGDVYQVSPQRFRLQARTRRAWRRVVDETCSLTRIAHECAFADLAHMSRSIAAMTGHSPAAWRRGLR